MAFWADFWQLGCRFGNFLTTKLPGGRIKNRAIPSKITKPRQQMQWQHNIFGFAYFGFAYFGIARYGLSVAASIVVKAKMNAIMRAVANQAFYFIGSHLFTASC
ncbi:MAG: hypothetical protein GX136_09050 [Clostridiales bacterium]|nr:hypothetical protein [Clostridiales bacterium]